MGFTDFRRQGLWNERRGEACISEFLFALITGRVVRVEGGDVHQIHRNRTLQTHPRRQSCPRKSKLSHFLLYHSITTPLSQLGGVVVGKVKGGGWKSVFSFFHPSSHSCKNPRMPEQQPRYHLQAVIKVLSSRVHGLAQVIFCMLGKLTIVETKGKTWRGVGGEGPLSYRFYCQLALCPRLGRLSHSARSAGYRACHTKCDLEKKEKSK